MIPFSLTISRVYILRQIKKLVLCVRGIRYTNDFGRTSACYHSERILAISFECQFGFINLDLDAVLDGDDLIRTNLARNSLAGNRIPAPPAAVAQTIHARLVCLFHDLCHRAECFTFIADAQLAAINARITNCWVSVKQFSKNDTATACQDWLRSTRLGRGSIKSHVRTVKVLGMGLFAFQERVHLWKGVTH